MVHQVRRFLVLLAYSAVVLGLMVIIFSFVPASPPLQLQGLLGLFLLCPLAWTHTEAVRFTRSGPHAPIVVEHEILSLVDSARPLKPVSLVGDIDARLHPARRTLGMNSAYLVFAAPDDRLLWRSPCLWPLQAVTAMQAEAEVFLTDPEKKEFDLCWGRGQKLHRVRDRLWFAFVFPLALVFVTTALMGVCLLRF